MSVTSLSNNNVVIVEGTSLPDLWFQTVWACLDYGKEFKIDSGSYAGVHTRFELPYYMGIATKPWWGSGTPVILPEWPETSNIPAPVEYGYVYGDDHHQRSYVEYLMTDCCQPLEEYTYGSRLADKFNNQIEQIIQRYREDGHRNNQLVLQIARPSDIQLKDPPCLRHIDTRIEDGFLKFFVYFRSWDLWGGFPANLAGIEALQQYMAGEIGVEQGPMIVESKGLHLYNYVHELAQARMNRGVS